MPTKNLSWRKLRKEDILNHYKPIADYAVIGDQKTCALVGIDGSIDWLCVPKFDSPSVFGSLLDVNRGGSFRTIPEVDEFETRQYYEDETNILLTEFRNQSGLVRITDFMPCFKVSGLEVSAGEIHRRLNCLEGKFLLDIRVQPRMNYGSVIPDISKVGSNGYTIVPSKSEEVVQELALISSVDFEITQTGSLAKLHQLKEKDQIDFVLRFSGLKYYHSQKTYTDEKLAETKSYWNTLASRCRYRGKWRDYVVRSALTLHLLDYSMTGAIIAAPTTSLPESIGGVRNWDYRYSWIRDSSFVLWAFHCIGDTGKQISYLNWLTSTFYLTIENLQIMLGISGERTLNEKILDHLEGYMCSAPVRIGNGAWDQFQLDVYGILLDTLYFSHVHHRKLSKKMYNHIVRPTVKLVELNWEKPDCGLWEVRGNKEHFVYSKVWCWVALDRAVKIAQELNMKDDSRAWENLRDTIRAAILEKGWDQSVKSFVRSFGSKHIDAANLLMPLVKFIDGKDPRMISTVSQIKKELLVEDKFLYRYKAEDGLGGDEGAFLVCSFWLVSCLALAGETAEAEALLDSLLECSNHVGLFSEEIDPKSGAMLGNFPQAFTHMGLISAVMDIEEQKSPK